MDMINAPRKDGRTPLQVAAMCIKQRCTNQNHTSFKHYGARGISFYPEWSNNYAAFEKYCLENGWTDGCQIDRIDNDGNYEPGNIQFISCLLNNRKREATKMNQDRIKEVFDLYSQHLTHEQIAVKMDISPATVSRVLSGKNWSDCHSERKSSLVNGKAQKLTATQVGDIIMAHFFDRVPIKRLARQYGLAPNNMRSIIRGKLWKDVWHDFQPILMFLPNPYPKST